MGTDIFSAGEFEQREPCQRRRADSKALHLCRECLGEAHAPSACAQWRQWLAKISEVRPEELEATSAESEDAANCLWLVTNSKPCPNCRSPIQKNEGCNHMKCSKVNNCIGTML